MPHGFRPLTDTAQAQTMIWPTLVPLVPREAAVYFYQRSPIDTPAEVDPQIDAAAAISLQYLRVKDPALMNTIIQIAKLHRERSINWVNDQIANANGPPPANVIGALLTLISHTGLSRPQHAPRRYPQSPLTHGEFSNLFGNIRVLPSDLYFLYQVVELKGGVEWLAAEKFDQELPLRLMINKYC
jgi:hypothetical protein